MPPTAPSLEKRIWTDSDFEVMGWHDCLVHGFASFWESREFALDLDYIVKWEEPEPPANSFSFWVCPATLVFHDAWLERFELRSDDGTLEISVLRRISLEGQPLTRWLIDGHDGDVSLLARGFTQFLRTAPRYSPRQCLSSTERGGHSFARVGA